MHFPLSVLEEGASHSLDGVWWLGWESVPDLLDDWKWVPDLLDDREWVDLLTCLERSLAGH